MASGCFTITFYHTCAMPKRNFCASAIGRRKQRVRIRLEDFVAYQNMPIAV